MNSTPILSPASFSKTADNPQRGSLRFRKLLARVVMVFISVVVALAIAEGMLRIIAWPTPGLEVNGRGPIALRQPGHNGGAFPPESSGRLRHYDYDVAWMVNAQGFRDQELVPKKSGEWRVGILGDSFAAGFGVEQNQRLPDVWYEAVKAKYPQVTIWNLATPLCGTICEREILEGVGRSYELDEILLVFYGGNDVEDNIERVSRPGAEDPYSNQTPSERVKQWLRENSRLMTFVWVNGIRAFANIKPPGIYSEKDLDRSWPYTAKALADFKQATTSRRLTILYIPALPEWDNATWQMLRERTGVGDDARFLVKRALQDWAQRENVPFLDSTAWFGNCETANDCTFPTDGYLNVRGHSIIGRELSNAWSVATTDERH